jgi:hypothetical protein
MLVERIQVRAPGLCTTGALMGPYGVLESKAWWQLPCAPAVAVERQAWVQQLCTLWRHALSPPPQLQALLTAEAVGQLIGMVRARTRANVDTV